MKLNAGEKTLTSNSVCGNKASFQASVSGHQFSVFWRQASGISFQFSGFRLRATVFSFLATGFGHQVSGSVSGDRLRASGFSFLATVFRQLCLIYLNLETLELLNEQFLFSQQEIMKTVSSLKPLLFSQLFQKELTLLFWV